MKDTEPSRARAIAIALLCLIPLSCEGPSGGLGDGPAEIGISDVRPVLQDGDIYDIRDAVARQDGGFWVLSRFSPHVTGVSPDGAIDVQFGPSGQGPGELRNPWQLIDDARGVGVYDVGSRSVKVFSPEGEQVATIMAPPSEGTVLNMISEISFGEPLRAERYADGWVFETYSAGQITSPGGLWRGRLVATQEGGSEFDTLIQYDSLRLDEVPDGSQIFAQAPLWTVCMGGTIKVLNPMDSTIVSIDSEGSSERHQIPLTARFLDDDIVMRYAELRLNYEIREAELEILPADRERLQRMAFEDMRTGSPDVLPPTRMLCDPNGRLWVAQFGLESGIRGFGTLWDVYDEDRRIAIVTFPERVLPLFIQGQEIVSVWEDEFDAQHLVRSANPLADGG